MVLSCHPLPAKATQVRDVGKFVHSAQVEVEADIVVAKTMTVLKIRVSQWAALKREIRSGVIVVDLG